MPLFNPQLLAEWTRGTWIKGIPAKISGVSVDTRTLRQGDLFVALNGPNFDGHEFLKPAFEGGASGAVINSCHKASDLKGPFLCVQDTARALLNMGAHYRKLVGAEIIAITGSVGKTTVKEMVADVLSSKAPTARTYGNMNNNIGLPLCLLSMDEMTRFGVFEIGMSHPGDLSPLCRSLAPDCGIVTAVGPAHLEFFDSIRSIAMEKSELIASLSIENTAVLRKDQEWYSLLRARARCRVITFAVEGDADYLFSFRSDDINLFNVCERATGEALDFKTPLPGPHMVENALFAIIVGRLYGLPWADIACAIESFKPQPMRWECVCVHGVNVINDAYNANPASTAAALLAFSSMKINGRKWLVLGGMLELGAFQESFHIDLGKKVAAGPWSGLITVGSFGMIIAEGAEKGGFEKGRIFKCANHAEAVSVLKKLAARGDAVLLKASRGEHMEDILVQWKGM